MLEPTSKTAAQEAAQSSPNQLDDKKNFENSTTFDSGYLSSQQINSTSDFGISSSEIAIDEKPSIRENIQFEQNIDSGLIDDQQDQFSSDYQQLKPTKGDPMLIQNQLPELMCELRLEGKNDLNRSKDKSQTNDNNLTKVEVIQRLCELCYQQDEDGETQLHIAVTNEPKYALGVIRLASAPWLLDIQNDYGQTAMHLAALSGQSNIIRTLLMFGAKATIRDYDGNTPLHLACQTVDLNVVKSLTLPISVAELKNVNVQQKYPCGSLPDLDQRNFYGENCVHIAARQNNIDVLKHLCYIGANMNARQGTDGFTPLHIAIENNSLTIVEFLLNECKTIDVETKTYGLKTAYQLACRSENNQLADLLEKRGCVLYSPQSSDDDENEDDDDEFDSSFEENDSHRCGQRTENTDLYALKNVENAVN